jgi:hypothetical protein
MRLHMLEAITVHLLFHFDISFESWDFIRTNRKPQFKQLIKSSAFIEDLQRIKIALLLMGEQQSVCILTVGF